MLVSDFVTDDPGDLYEQLFVLGIIGVEEFSQKKYDKGRTYDFDNPLIFFPFFNYYLSLWNKDRYCHYLENYIGKYKSKGNCADYELLLKTLNNNVEVISFPELWNRIKKSELNKGTKKKFNLLLNDEFKERYCWAKNITEGEKDQTFKDISKIVENIQLKQSMVSLSEICEVFKNHIRKPISPRSHFKLEGENET